MSRGKKKKKTKLNKPTGKFGSVFLHNLNQSKIFVTLSPAFSPVLIHITFFNFTILVILFTTFNNNVLFHKNKSCKWNSLSFNWPNNRIY